MSELSRKESWQPKSRQVYSFSVSECCNLGPVLVLYPEGVWYKYQTEADLDEIVSEHLPHGKPVERLRLRPAPDFGAIDHVAS